MRDRFGKFTSRAFRICFNIYFGAIIGKVMGSQSLAKTMLCLTDETDQISARSWTDICFFSTTLVVQKISCEVVNMCRSVRLYLTDMKIWLGRLLRLWFVREPWYNIWSKRVQHLTRILYVSSVTRDLGKDRCWTKITFYSYMEWYHIWSLVRVTQRHSGGLSSNQHNATIRPL